MMNQLDSQTKLSLFSFSFVSSAFGFLWFLKIATYLVLLHLWTFCVSGLDSFYSLDFVKLLSLIKMVCILSSEFWLIVFLYVVHCCSFMHM